MADTELLKYARSRDDQNFVWRVAAALTVQAQYDASVNANQSVEGLAMRHWVLDNPMTPIDMMTAFASTMPEIAAKVSVTTNGAVDTSEALDSDIRYVVGAKWEAVAAHKFKVA